MSKKKITNEEAFRNAVKNTFSIAGTLKELGLKPSGANYSLFKKRLKQWNVSNEHFTGMGHLRGKRHNWSKKIPLSEILVENSTYSATSLLRRRLIQEGYFEHRCYNCFRTEWEGNPIPLELEHKNGENTDNRIENLTLLCPNCHALTSTYRGRNIKIGRTTKEEKRKKQQEYRRAYREKQQSLSGKITKRRTKRKQEAKYCECGKKIHIRSKSCESCMKRPTKINWPPIEELKSMLNNSSFLAVARKLGVSDNAIRKHIRLHSL